MRKTKVILALGSHAQVDLSRLAQPREDPVFFRTRVSVFIESIMSARGNKSSGGAVGLAVLEAAWPDADHDTSKANAYLIGQLGGSLNVGRHPMDPRLDWGFNDLIVRANADHPGSIVCMAEMQTNEAMTAMAELKAVVAQLSNGIPQEERIALESRRLALEMGSGLLRDKMVFRMIEHFRGVQGAGGTLGGVLVVRGPAHKPMRMLFDDSYDVRVKEDKSGHLPRFHRDALVRFYREGGLEEREFERLARMRIAWECLLEERAIAPSDAEGRKKAEKEAGRVVGSCRAESDIGI